MSHYCEENIIGYTYTHGSIIPIYKPLKNVAVIPAPIICSQCNMIIAFENGPNSKAVCLKCHKSKN